MLELDDFESMLKNRFGYECMNIHLSNSKRIIDDASYAIAMKLDPTVGVNQYIYSKLLDIFQYKDFKYKDITSFYSFLGLRSGRIGGGAGLVAYEVFSGNDSDFKLEVVYDYKKRKLWYHYYLRKRDGTF